MINYHFETNFSLINKEQYTDWIILVVSKEKARIGELNYIFCDDEYLGEINMRYLSHDTLTDIITFDYSSDDSIAGDIFISIERILENAKLFKEDPENELRRVMIHGVLHLIGYDDKTDEDKKLMREKEDEFIKMFHVEQ